MLGNLFESWNDFLNHVKNEMEKENFQDFIQKRGLKESQIKMIWNPNSFYDMDYLQLEEWNGLRKMFPTKELYEELKKMISIVELRSCRIAVEDKDIVFYVVGEELSQEDGYLCYTYGFQERTKLGKEYYVYQCLVTK